MSFHGRLNASDPAGLPEGWASSINPLTPLQSPSLLQSKLRAKMLKLRALNPKESCVKFASAGSNIFGPAHDQGCLFLLPARRCHHLTHP